jgi:hypothetical protein
MNTSADLETAGAEERRPGGNIEASGFRTGSGRGQGRRTASSSQLHEACPDRNDWMRKEQN